MFAIVHHQQNLLQLCLVAMTVTVPSLPKEIGVPVKINVILLRFPQAKLFLAKIIVLDFTGVRFDAIVGKFRTWHACLGLWIKERVR